MLRCPLPLMEMPSIYRERVWGEVQKIRELVPREEEQEGQGS